jgi:hypothetical protein
VAGEFIMASPGYEGPVSGMRVDTQGLGDGNEVAVLVGICVGGSAVDDGTGVGGIAVYVAEGGGLGE